MNIFHRRFLLTPILAATMFVATAATCAAGYRWADRDGTLHFSDSPPTEGIPQDNLDPADPEQRPLLDKPLVIYRDKVFRLALTAEADDLLQFELTYSDIQRSFPEIISGNARLQIGSVDQARSYTYIAYTVAPVDGGSRALQLTNRLSKQSPAHLETKSLVISLYDYGDDRKKYHNLFTKEIPFSKIWHKRKGVVYQ